MGKRTTIRSLKARANQTLNTANFTLKEILDGVTVKAEVDWPEMAEMLKGVLPLVMGGKNPTGKKWRELPIRLTINIKE